MELMKIIAYIIIGFVVFGILITIAYAIYDVNFVKTGCKLWAKQIQDQGTASYSIPAIVGGYVAGYFCNISWY
jgi:fructose-specific phosphotransferase system IIC component